MLCKRHKALYGKAHGTHLGETSMLIRDRLANDGRFLFRWRSYAPLVLLPLFLVALPEEERISQAVGPAVEHIIFFASVLVAFVGLAIRWATIAFVPSGTSGRNTVGQRADRLNTSGMYSMVRNPLYLGNFVAILGVLICVKVWWLVATFALLYWLYIERVIAVEEAFLEQKFGDDYRAWAAHTPVFLPRIFNWVRPNQPFSVTFLLRREYNGLLAVGASFFCPRVDPGRIRAARADCRMGGGGCRVGHPGCHDTRAVPGAALPEDAHPCARHLRCGPFWAAR
jgi:protein-S-isoprenylcysteine O-methyltransferase Ste14